MLDINDIVLKLIDRGEEHLRYDDLLELID